jgi:myosin heavy subunit
MELEEFHFFHLNNIFYMLVEGTCAEEKKQLFPLPTSSFHYLSNQAVDGRDKEADVKSFVRLKKAILSLGLGNQEVMEIFGVLSGILYLGNIQV